MSCNFLFEKFPKTFNKISEVFSTFSNSNKTALIAPKLVQNHYFDQNFP